MIVQNMFARISANQEADIFREFVRQSFEPSLYRSGYYCAI